MQLYITSLIIVLLSVNLWSLSILPNDDRILYRGSIYAQVDSKEGEFLRFKPELLGKPNPRLHGFNSEKARTTAGVSISFITNSENITLKFKDKGSSGFGIYQDKQFQEIIKTKADGLISIKSTRPGEMVEYRIVLPTWKNPVFLGMELEAGSQIVKAEKRNKTYVAIGDSITHGRGQDVGHQSWGYIAAEVLGMEFYNLAVGGSNANAYQPLSIKDIEKVDLVSILWGYNDWVNRGKTVDEYTNDMNAAIDVIRLSHPDVPIAILRVLQTKTTVSKRTGEQFSAKDFREAVDKLVAKRREKGDENIHIIASDSMTNLEDLRDPVHLNFKGAAKLGIAAAAEFSKIL